MKAIINSGSEDSLLNQVSDSILVKKQEAKNKNLQKLLVECKTYLTMSNAFVDKNLQNESTRLINAIENELKT